MNMTYADENNLEIILKIGKEPTSSVNNNLGVQEKKYKKIKK